MGRRQESNLGDIMGVMDPSDGLRDRSERPNQKLKVRIQLTKELDSDLFKSLKPDLRNDDMDVEVDANLSNAIVVSGIPPEGGYEEMNVLMKVKTHDDGAYIVLL